MVEASELMNIRETCIFFGGKDSPLDPSTLYKGIRLGRFPKPIKIGPQTSRWRRSECEAALARLQRDS
jgi:predicted DNA-binding transcriptional regulator AlpA